MQVINKNMKRGQIDKGDVPDCQNTGNSQNNLIIALRQSEIPSDGGSAPASFRKTIKESGTLAAGQVKATNQSREPVGLGFIVTCLNCPK
jgi:hypothetical protein